uniref:Uncharacterized protein n=1 Tax=Physcomitrium patens TaxID=3218 RepID=A0A2K1JUY8_PHYPA|nr:hypothetical protein PHYPA_015107 [Physcomitrium patens]
MVMPRGESGGGDLLVQHQDQQLHLPRVSICLQRDNPPGGKLGRGRDSHIHSERERERARETEVNDTQVSRLHKVSLKRIYTTINKRKQAIYMYHYRLTNAGSAVLTTQRDSLLLIAAWIRPRIQHTPSN